MSRTVLVCALFTAAAIATPASAEVFKWVDTEGTTHYSDLAPAKGSAEVVPDRITVYKPRQPPSPSAASRDRVLESRIEQLERQLQSERRAREDYAYAADAAWQTAYQQCVNDRRVDCDTPSAYTPSYPAYAPYVVVGAHHRFVPQAAVPARVAPPPAPVSHFNPALYGGRSGVFGSSGPRR